MEVKSKQQQILEGLDNIVNINHIAPAMKTRLILEYLDSQGVRLLTHDGDVFTPKLERLVD